MILHMVTMVFLIILPAFLSAETLRYRLIVREDPANAMVIGWEQQRVNNAVVYYGTEDFGRRYENYPLSKRPDRTVEHKGMNNCFARLRNLQPSTTYYFVIRDSEGISQRYSFQTLPNSSDQTLSIIAGGDSRRAQWDTSAYEPRILSNMMVAKLRPHLVVFAGDFTNRNSVGQWRSWFDDWQYHICEDGRMTPILAARGNHESKNEDIVNLFDSPHPDVFFATKLGGDLIRLYTLNSNISISGAQTDWLTDDLIAHQDQTYWTLVQYHHPIVPHQTSKTYKILQYRYWAPLFYQHRVQLVIECDSHVAKNSWPIIPSNRWYADGGFVRNDVKGTVYTGEGSWAITRNADVSYRWTRESGSFTQVKWLKVTREQIEIRTVLTSNAQEVMPLTDESRFNIPTSLNVWNTRHGETYVIDRPHLISTP